MPGKTPSSQKKSGTPGDLILGKSQMAGMVRAHDWSSTPLGPIDHWSEILLSSINLMLACAFPSLVCWGTDLVQLYNDAFIPLLAERHPSSLGQTGPTNSLIFLGLSPRREKARPQTSIQKTRAMESQVVAGPVRLMSPNCRCPKQSSISSGPVRTPTTLIATRAGAKPFLPSYSRWQVRAAMTPL